MNNPLQGSGRHEVWFGTAFPLAILLWTMVFILSNEGQFRKSIQIDPIDQLVQRFGSSSLSAVCFPLTVSGARWLCETRTVGSALPHAGAVRPIPFTSVTNCNHHERSRAGTSCLAGRRICFGTPWSATRRIVPPFPRGAAPVLLQHYQHSTVRSRPSVPQARAWLAGP